MLKIQVGRAYFLNDSRKKRERSGLYPTPATIPVAALLRAMGQVASFFDAMIADGVEDCDATLQPAQAGVMAIYDEDFNYLTKICLGHMREAACQMLAKAHAFGEQLIVAGSGASGHPVAFLSTGDADTPIAGISDRRTSVHHGIHVVDSPERPSIVACAALIRASSCSNPSAHKNAFDVSTLRSPQSA